MRDELIQDFGKILALVVPRVSFMLWEKEELRELIGFEKLSKTEQDRIFNELEVTFLGLFYLYLDNLSSQLESAEEKKLTERLKLALVEGFIQVFNDLNLESKLINQWRVLIDLRFEEYQKDFILLLKEGKKNKELKSDEKLQLFWARTQTIILNGLSHIRRGNVDERDPLRKVLQDWVFVVDKLYSEAVKDIVFKPVGES